MIIQQLLDVFKLLGISILGTGTVLAFVEFFFQSEQQSWASRAKGFLFWVLYFATGLSIALIIQLWIASWGIEPLLVFDASRPMFIGNSTLSLIAMYGVFPLLYGMMIDFLFYWFHRAQHTFPFMWKFHSVHHSIRELNSLNCWHHFMEEIVKLPFIFVPMNFIFRMSVAEVAIVTVVLISWGMFVHSNTWCSIGPLRYFLTDPRFHRVHHSRNPRHFDRNFAVVFSLWDIVFGTAHFPTSDEKVVTGLDKQSEPATIKQFFLQPWLRKV